MLHFLALLALRCCACLMMVGALVSRAWGWSEYASPELYVVYFQLSDEGNRYFIVNNDGGDSQRLTWANGVAKLDCSPDGRTFAFLDNAGHLYVMTAAGIVYDRAEDHLFTTVNVADDGTTVLFDAASDSLRIHTRSGDLAARVEPKYDMDRFDVSAHSLVLWNERFEQIHVVAPESGSVLAHVERGHSGAWLAAPHVFTYYDLVTNIDGLATAGGQYVVDVRTQAVVRIGGWTYSRPISPDGMEVAAGLVTSGSGGLAQVVVYNFWGAPQRRQLTHDPEHASQPICFLAFRPDLLLAEG